jgi:hypothetical protein
MGGEFRVPATQGSDDGLGNHTVTMYRSSVFSNSGILPTIPDTWIDSTPNAGTNTPQTTNTTLAVGNSPFQSGQESVVLLLESTNVIRFQKQILGIHSHFQPTVILLLPQPLASRLVDLAEYGMIGMLQL